MRVRIQATSPSLPRQRLGQRSECLMMRRRDRRSTSSWRPPTTGSLTSLVISGYLSPSSSALHKLALSICLFGGRLVIWRLSPFQQQESCANSFLLLLLLLLLFLAAADVLNG